MPEAELCIVKLINEWELAQEQLIFMFQKTDPFYKLTVILPLRSHRYVIKLG